MALTKKQKEVLDYIHTYTNEYGYAPTQREIKDHFDLKSFGSVQRYIKYLVDAGHLENDGNARRGLVVVDGGAKTPEKKSKTQAVEAAGFEVPLLGKVAAGNPIEAIENYDQSVTVPPHMIKQNYKHFALRVQGDSMIEDGILEDDIIVCRHQTTASQGQTVVAVIDGEATVKNFFKSKKGYELHPANSRLSPIMVKKDSGDFKLVGVLVGLLRSYV